MSDNFVNRILSNSLSNKNHQNIDPNDPNREFKLMESVFVDAFAEQKKSRRWGVIFKSLTFIYLFGGALVFFMAAKGFNGASNKKPHTAFVKLEGAIAADSAASAWRVNAGLRKAFENKQAKGVILAINSPGGSPVQSAYVYDQIMKLRKENPDKKVYAVIGDIGASGGYYIASAANEIYANRSSLVGSIGVTASSFGFVDVMKKLGVERRHFTSGENKAFLDPFSPLKEQQKEFWETVLASVHEQFKAVVKEGRGDRLNLTKEITSGLIWNGEQAKVLGLIDGLGSPRYVAEEIIGEKELINYSVQDSPIQSLVKKLGVSIGQGLGVAALDANNNGMINMR